MSLELFINKELSFSVYRDDIEKIIFNKETGLLTICTNLLDINNSAYLSYDLDDYESVKDRLMEFEDNNISSDFIMIECDNYTYLLRVEEIYSVLSYGEKIEIRMKNTLVYSDYVEGKIPHGASEIYTAQKYVIEIVDTINQFDK